MAIPRTKQGTGSIDTFDHFDAAYRFDLKQHVVTYYAEELAAFRAVPADREIVRHPDLIAFPIHYQYLAAIAGHGCRGRQLF